MTYEEALTIVEKEGEYSYIGGLKKKLVIVPLNNPYFSEYNELLNAKNLSKEDVKLYAKDNKYTVWQYNVQYIKGETFKI